MITKNSQHLTKNAIPNGEGFDALPVSFNPSSPALLLMGEGRKCQT